MAVVGEDQGFARAPAAILGNERLQHRDSQTLVVALYSAVFAAGVRASQSIDAMAVVYMGTTLVWFLIALRFVSPTRIVARARQTEVQA
jgi:hypothetical protein